MCRFVRCKTQVGFCLEADFKSLARAARYFAFVVISISLSKTNLMAFNLMLLHVHVYVYQRTMWKLFMASGNRAGNMSGTRNAAYHRCPVELVLIQDCQISLVVNVDKLHP